MENTQKTKIVKNSTTTNKPNSQNNNVKTTQVQVQNEETKNNTKPTTKKVVTKRIVVKKVVKKTAQPKTEQKETTQSKNVTNVKTQVVKNQSTKDNTQQNQDKTQTSQRKTTKKVVDSKTQKEIDKVKAEIKKTENEIELIGIFSKLEKNLVEVLQTIPKDVSEEGLKSEKANIQSYMKKVELARKLFDEYENTARLITNLSESKENDLESIEISKKVMEIREGKSKTNIDEKELLRQVQAIEKQSKGMEKIEIETLGDRVVVKKKKVSSKEKSL